MINMLVHQQLSLRLLKEHDVLDKYWTEKKIGRIKPWEENIPYEWFIMKSIGAGTNFAPRKIHFRNVSGSGVTIGGGGSGQCLSYQRTL